MNDAKTIIEFIRYAERLKTELRHATRSDNQRESVADHTWRLALFLILVAPKLKLEIDLSKALKMTIIHDIVEIEAKDIPVLKQINDDTFSLQKKKAEILAINKIKKLLGDNGQEIYDLWNEYEDSKTNEAKIIKALDKLEGQLQFLEDPIRKFTIDEQDSIELLLNQTKKLCDIDPFLQELDKTTIASRKKRILCN